MDPVSDEVKAYEPDRSWKGKLRRRLVRLQARRPLTTAPDRPMVSFSFDDAPLTAATTGAEILEARGLRGTFFVSAALSGTQAPMGLCARAGDYHRLAEAGHEIACHTHSHLDCGQATGREALIDVARNERVLQAWGLEAPRTFAYPYGDVAKGPKAALSSRFSILRALHPGVIVRGSDLNQAPAVGVEGAAGEETARRWLDIARKRCGWLILYTHDVREDASPWGCTPAVWAGLVDAAIAEGFDIVTVEDGARRLGL
jgi:peptidoglycan/xylan/chitin deacetylase (PgdA/CDA1 family)